MSNKKLTTQEVFDKAVLGMLKQGRKSMETFRTSSGSTASQCKYRLPKEDGVILKCAVGQLIDDSYPRLALLVENNPGMDRTSHWNELLEEALEFSGVFEDDSCYEMLSKLQRAHDEAGSSTFLDDFMFKAKSIAKNYGLTMPELPSA